MESHLFVLHVDIFFCKVKQKGPRQEGRNPEIGYKRFVKLFYLLLSLANFMNSALERVLSTALSHRSPIVVFLVEDIFNLDLICLIMKVK